MPASSSFIPFIIAFTIGINSIFLVFTIRENTCPHVFELFWHFLILIFLWIYFNLYVRSMCQSDRFSRVYGACQDGQFMNEHILSSPHVASRHVTSNLLRRKKLNVEYQGLFKNYRIYIWAVKWSNHFRVMM